MPKGMMRKGRPMPFGKNVLSWFPLVLLLTIALAVISGCTDELTSFPAAAGSQTGIIRGTVRQLGTAAPLESVQIETEPATVTVYTDAAGAFSLSGLSAQSLRVVASKSSYETRVQAVTVLPGMTQQVDLDLQASTTVGSLQGTITDGVFALAGVKVRTLPPTLDLLTAADGRYTYAGIQPGAYQVLASRPGYFGDSHYVHVAEGASVTLNMAMGKRGDGVLDGWIRTASFSSLNGVQIDLYGETGQLLASAVTGSNGRYTFTNLTTGLYTLSAYTLNYYVGTRSVYVVAGPDGAGRQILANGDMVLALSSSPDPVPGALAGTVRDESYSPISGVTVTLVSVTPTAPTTVTDGDGRWLLSNVPQGTIRIEATPPASWVAATVDVLVGGGTTPDGGLRLAPQ